MSNTFKKNFQEEWQLFLRQKWTVIFTTIWLVWFTSVGRNFAYYIHEPREMLRDLGFEVIPAFDYKFYHIPDIILIIQQLSILSVFSSLLFIERKPEFPYFISISSRILKVMAIGHTLRVLTFVPTSLPGTAPHCRPESPHFSEYNPPDNLFEVFTSISYYGYKTCGDLIFSGQIFSMLILAIATTRYLPKFASRKFTVTFLIVQWILTVVQIYIILASRNHYSVDVVVACYIAPLLWKAYSVKFPYDDTFDSLMLQSERVSSANKHQKFTEESQQDEVLKSQIDASENKFSF